MINLSNFSDRLKEFMQEKSLNAPALAKEIGAERSTINGLMRGTFIPSTSVFIALVEYFNCSADYLLGLTDVFSERKFSAVKPFADKLRVCMNEKNITEYRLQKDLNLSRSLTYRWLRNIAVPRVDTLVRLAEYFNCSVDFLLGRED